MSKIVGIDLGTTKSVVGVMEGGKPVIIPDKAGHRSIPSLILVTHDEQIFVGSLARNHPERYKGKNITISSVKRLMGKKGETGWGWWKTYPQEVSSFILAELKEQAEKYLGQEVNSAVIAIPSHFDENQRRATKEAAEIAGLEVKRLLNEATAAALIYGLRKRGDHKVLIFDLGGGTLDVSIVECGQGVYEVKSIEGDSKLGGDDFDQIIVDYVLDKLRQKYGSTLELDSFQKMMLKEAAEISKIELSSNLNALIHIPAFLHIVNKYHDLDVSIDRKTFERLAKSLFDRAFTVLEEALKAAGLRPADLDALLLLGGSSRIPIIRERLRRELMIYPFTGVDPEICVAQGAAIMAGVLSGDFKDLLLLDVIPSSYGIGVKDDNFEKLIEKNTTVPTMISKIFTTTEDNQTIIPISVYHGEGEKASENTFLSTFQLIGIPPAPSGIPQIEVTFDIEANMIVRVSAKDKATGKQQNIVLKSPYGLNDAQIRLMQQKLQSWLYERKILEPLDSLKFSIEELLSKQLTALDWEEISNLKERYELLCKLKNKNSYKELEDAIISTKSIYERALEKVTKYERAVKEINHLIAKIDELIPSLKTSYQNEARLLNQGRDLLKRYVEQKLRYEELQNILSSVRTSYKDVLVRLAKQPDEKSCILALESLAEFPAEEIMPIFLSLIKNENSNIRAKTFELLFKMETKGTRIIEMIAEALGDPSSEIRLLALEFVEQSQETSCLPQLFTLLHSEKNEPIKEKVIGVLGGLKDVKVIPHLLKLLMDGNQKFRTLAISSLEKNIEMMDKAFRKLFDLIQNVVEKRHSLGIRDSIFLRRVSKNYPEMYEVVQTLKAYSKIHI